MYSTYVGSNSGSCLHALSFATSRPYLSQGSCAGWYTDNPALGYDECKLACPLACKRRNPWHCRAQGRGKTVRPAPKTRSPGGLVKKGLQKVEGNTAEEQRWKIFNLTEYNRPWQVPWRKRETALGMLAWALSFLLTGFLTVPVLIWAAKGNMQELTASQKTLYILLNQVLETGIGIGIIRFVLRDFEPLPADIFRISFREPFAKPHGWAIWALLGILVAPFAVSLTEGVFTAAGYTKLGPGTVDEVVKILSPDGATLGGLLGVTAILAPILEEFVFRGFLLTSLTAVVPVPLAVAGSSLGFAAAHLSARDLPELAVLGVLLSGAYLRSRNLLTPILIHGLWNGTTLAALFALAQASPPSG